MNGFPFVIKLGMLYHITTNDLHNFSKKGKDILNDTGSGDIFLGDAPHAPHDQQQARILMTSNPG